MPPDNEWLSQITEDIIDPGRPIVDPHHHLWYDGPPRGYPYLLNDLWADTNSGHNIVQTVFIEAGADYRKDGPDVDGDRVHVAPLPEPGTELGSSHVGRGGFWYGQHTSARTAFRIECYPNTRSDYQGFRLARTLTRS